MKRVRSIFGIFTVFLLIILASFLLLSWQSTANLKASLIQTAQLQTKYAATLLEQKGKEIEIEADGILYGENMQNLYAAIENNDVYEYVQQINKMKSFFQEHQGRTVGMSGMTLYWPKSGREISTLRQGYFEDSFWENNKESQWKSANKQEIFYMRRRTVEWMGEDQEVWLVLRMDQDFLYEIKEMAAGMDQGGSILMFGGEINVLSQKSVEQKKPELLVTDIRMPRVSGLDLVKYIDEKNYPTKTIILSGYSEFEYAQQALRYGVTEYLVKPILKKDFQISLEHVMEKFFEKEESFPDDGISAVKKYIAEHVGEDLSLEILGEVAHLHPAYLSKTFKEETGKNLSAYITDVKMERAAELLSGTDRWVHEIMESVGYQKSQYFSKIFKEKYGVTPNEYRRTHRG